MLFWTVALTIGAVTAALLALAMARGGQEAGPTAAQDLAVYRDQLGEVEKDLARGLLSPADAERTRLEISRRVLEADRARAGTAAAPDAPQAATTLATLLVAAAVPLGAATLYRTIGAPGAPDMPLEARLERAEKARDSRPSQADAEARIGPRAASGAAPAVDPEYLALVARLREVVAERPDDARGQALLARHEAALGDFPAAAAAQAELVALRGEAAEAGDHATLAELMILAAEGYVSPEAEAELGAALRLAPGNGSARYYSGLMFAQLGRPDLAFRFWSTLLSEGPPDAPWIPAIRAGIEDVAWRAGQFDFVLPPAPGAEETPAPPGPTAGDVAAAAEMGEAERTEMIRGMVEGLAARLAAEGGPAPDWARLIRAYGVLGEREAARPILAEARAVFAGDGAALAEIEAAARDAGLAE